MDKYSNALIKTTKIIVGSLLMLLGLGFVALPFILCPLFGDYNIIFACFSCVGIFAGIFFFSSGFGMAILQEKYYDTGTVHQGNSLFAIIPSKSYYKRKFWTCLTESVCNFLLAISHIILICFKIMEPIGLVFTMLSIIISVVSFILMLSAKEQIKMYK